MKIRRMGWGLLTAALLFPGAVCGAQESITVTDLAGREISLEGPAERIVSISPSGCEFLNAMGGIELLTARGEACDFPEEIQSLPVVNPGSEIDIGRIISLDAQLVLAGEGMLTEEQEAELSQAGIRTAVCGAKDFDGIFQAADMIGTLIGRAEVAGYVKEGMLSTLEILEAAVEHREGGPETIYFEMAVPGEGLYAAGKGTIPDMVSELIGLENVFSDLEGITEVTGEMVIGRNPDHIAVLSPDHLAEPALEEEVLARPGWENITAVQENSVRTFSAGELAAPGPRLADQAAMLYDFAFGEEDPLMQALY